MKPSSLIAGCGCLLLSLLLAAGLATGAVVLILGSIDVSQSVVQPAPAVVPAPSVTPAPTPTPPVCPGPDCPQPQPKPQPRRPRWGADECRPVGPVSEGRRVTDGPVHNGQEVQIDLPADILKRNIASKGLGCCVFRSINYAGLWQNCSEVIDLPERMKEAGVAGGGWPDKVDSVMKQFAPNTPYIQIQDGDWDTIKLALRTGRCVAITVMGGAHMVCLVKCENGMAAFRDNNAVGPNELWWMTEEEAKRETICNYTGGKFWAVVLLNPRPPAPPRARTTLALFPLLRSELYIPQLSPPRQDGQYEWRSLGHTAADQWALWLDGRQVGAYTAAEDYYRECSPEGGWRETRWRRPPVPLPASALHRLGEKMPPGVCVEHLGDTPRYSICGHEATRGQVQAALEDDSAKLSLTAIGEPAETALVAADLARPENAQLKQHVVFQQYTRDNWAISPDRYGFDVGTTGHASVYLQDAAGNVLYHPAAYTSPQTMTELRKKDPGYIPANDPGQPTPLVPGSGGNLFEVVGIIVLVGGALVIGVLLLALLTIGGLHVAIEI